MGTNLIIYSYNDIKFTTVKVEVITINNIRQSHKELGNFLKTRRAKISSSQVGLPDGIRRRTPGLRREEVAALAGIGLTWYTWLEQGRPIKVSSQVLESISRVLRLDRQEIVHLYTLAQQFPPSYFPDIQETVDPMLQNVLDSLKYSPSMILDIRWNIIAWNKAAELIFVDYSKINICQRNQMQIMFMNDNYKALFPDWEVYAKIMIAEFRVACGKNVEDTWLLNFIKKLSFESKEFKDWWSMHNVESKPEIFKTIHHPALGNLSFEHTSYLISEDTNLKMHINTAPPKSDTEKKVKAYLEEKMTM